eukprot:GHVT01094585.1.p1 GENE.GHVT01094585.1~~GHVT01094585.1.p1  ORF type:complete len:505 (-),score=87.21 GHVT01094585.1:2508-4022(-)
MGENTSAVEEGGGVGEAIAGQDDFGRAAAQNELGETSGDASGGGVDRGDAGAGQLSGAGEGQQRAQGAAGTEAGAGDDEHMQTGGSDSWEDAHDDEHFDDEDEDEYEDEESDSYDDENDAEDELLECDEPEMNSASSSSSSSSSSPSSSSSSLTQQPQLSIEPGAKQYGCRHYIRRCQVIAPCCQEKFWCRHCHNDIKNGTSVSPREAHEMDRKAVIEVECALCNFRQPPSHSCAQCTIEFGKYYCGECKFWDDRGIEKQVYHCDQCEICRVGPRDRFFHCPRCGSCYPLSMKEKHTCVEGAMKRPCPICLEDMFASILPSQVLRCGHTMHSECLNTLVSGNGLNARRCPVCSKSFGNHGKLWRSYDRAVAATPIPAESQRLAKIVCSDCHGYSITEFHFVGLNKKTKFPPKTFLFSRWAVGFAVGWSAEKLYRERFFCVAAAHIPQGGQRGRSRRPAQDSFSFVYLGGGYFFSTACGPLVGVCSWQLDCCAACRPSEVIMRVG